MLVPKPSKMESMRLVPTAFGLVALAWCSGLAPLPRLDAAAPPLSVATTASLAAVARAELTAGRIPGAVLLVGLDGDVAYREAFGLRSTRGPSLAMTSDTVFDLASLTKVVATTTAVMQLVEQGRIDLDAPAARYWRDFGLHGKSAITVRHLLTHYSGLRADLPLGRPWSGYDTAMRMLTAERPDHAPGVAYVYSDENFAVLGELVRRVSGQPLDVYCERHVFAPLGMRQTGFRPSAEMMERFAPTFAVPSAGRVPVVNDPMARRMGGVAGHAGLFSTADDLALFATVLLHGGSHRGVRVLNPESVATMIEPASPPDALHPRGLGWDLAAPFTPPEHGGARRPSFGHTGYTGTMLWVDPASSSYVIVLTNRTHLGGRGDAQPLRRAVLAEVSAALASAPLTRPDREPVPSSAR